jgi:hypothetical protein
MATVEFTGDSASVVDALLAEFTYPDGQALPVLGVRWSQGARENRRGPDGASVWEVVEPPGWVAEVMSWGEPKSAAVLRDTVLVSGVRVLLDPKASAKTGRLLITATNGRLYVEHREA